MGTLSPDSRATKTAFYRSFMIHPGFIIFDKKISLLSVINPDVS